MKTDMLKKGSLGLALGSGGYRGFAHLGILRSFEKHHIPIDFLSGASSGALVAAAYAVHKDLDKLQEILMDETRKNWMAAIDPSRSGGLIAGGKFSVFLDDILGHGSFADARIPLRIIATDLLTGQPQIFSEGDLTTAVRSSTSVPLVFKPEVYGDKLLVDGGLSDPVPVALLEDMGADITIAVNLYSKNELHGKKLSIPQIAMRTLHIFLFNLAEAKEKAADVAIDIDTSGFSNSNMVSKYFSKSMAEGIIALGESAADNAVPRIKALLAARKRR